MILLVGGLFAVSAWSRATASTSAADASPTSPPWSAPSATRRRELTAQAGSLNAEVEALSTQLGDRSVKRAQDEIATLVDPAGLTGRRARP